MPIYAYKCAECSHELEVIRKVSDPPLIECPNCGKPALVKQVTAAGFQLKGGGWYVTDFRDQGAGKKKDADKPDEKPKTDQPDASVDAKAGAKPDTPAAPSATSNNDAAPKTDKKTTPKTDVAPKPAAPSPAPTPTGGKAGGSTSGT